MTTPPRTDEARRIAELERVRDKLQFRLYVAVNVAAMFAIACVACLVVLARS